jgi:hypothetical protein
MSEQLVAIRNTISGAVHEYPASEAARILAHPIWGAVNVEARTAKPEVLGVDSERKTVKEEK